MQKTVTRCDITMFDVSEIAPGLFSGRDSEGMLRIFDLEIFRGYAQHWPTPKNPDGWYVRVWNHDHSRVLERGGYKTQRGAERQLIARAITLNGEA